MNNQNLVIELAKVKKDYFMVYKPCNQVKKVFYHNKREEAYRQVLRMVMGYFIGESEKYPLSYEKLSTIITTLTLVFAKKLFIGFIQNVAKTFIIIYNSNIVLVYF